MNSRALLRTKRVLLFVFLFPLVIPHLPPAHATEQSCKKPELEWNQWLAFTKENNPGVDFVEIHGVQRFNLLTEFACAETTTDCPPDHAYVFHCENKIQVLVVFEKSGCVTLAEELDARTFMEVVGTDHEC